MSGALDALSLPLDGVRLIEAGAGSGKTWTLATLYLRLLLERRLTPERVLVMTFTRAATAELAGRLRARLELAERLLHEEAPAQPRDGDGAEAAATRRLLAQALAAWDGDLDGLRRHARAARHAGDLAAVSTLHGFCQRALREIGFAAGASLEAHALLENEQALREEAAADFWRARGASDAAAARLLADAWGTPQKLARALGEARWEGRRVHAPADDGAAQAARRALERAAAAVRALNGDAFAAARQAIERATVGKTRAAKGKALERIAAAVRNEAAFDPADASLLTEAAKLLPTAFVGSQALGIAEAPALDAIRAWHAAADAARAAEAAARADAAARLLLEAR
ncbi:UvrD-helicase domain-containing protein, partial [Mizugakiibacter sediminis]|uniref:UvrD-helicase domain-containing protein n=1 Tax=Mizugakiibacter sediminis TaxID=1475481 RepID=UPI000A93B33A